MPSTTTAEWREYTAEDPAEGSLKVDTDSNVEAILEIGQPDGEAHSCGLDRATAREFGTCVIAWTGSPLAWADHTWEGTFGRINLLVEDGSPSFIIVDKDGDSPAFAMHVDLATDLAQRLIVWAGVDV